MFEMKHEYNSSVERHVLANQKVRGSRLGQGSKFLYSCTNLHEFSHRNHEGKHEFKTREVHEKWS